MKNLVSIVIPVYNGEKYIEEAINSALNQSYKNIEIIVINDGSSDNTDFLCKKYVNKIRYYKKQNGGVASALNLGISKMRGQYFSWLSHDDLLFPDKIKTQMEFIKSKNINNCILFSDYELISENGNHIMDSVKDVNEIKIKNEYSLLRGHVNGITMLIPKKAFNDIGLFDEKRRCTQDYALWNKMIKVYSFIHIPKILAKTRIHSLQDTNTNPNVLKEGNPLWIKMIEDVSNKRKIELEGSIYNYYLQMYIFLKNTPYKNAMIYCKDRCKSIDKKFFSSDFKDIKDDKSIFIRLFAFFYKNRFLSGTKILLSRLFKRKG